MRAKDRSASSPWIFVVVGVAMLALHNVEARAAEAFPYVAYVIEADTYVRSGPGNQHYATGQLPAGYAVEVYRHDREGWCAIRPPEGSFSLAPAHQVRILDSRTAEVTAPGVVARVGSALGEQRNAVQVLLERGEVVQLVEQPAPGQSWLKIAPPAGEFRWIASRRLSRTPPTEGASAPAAGWMARTQSSNVASAAPQTTPFALPQDMPLAPADGDDSFAHLQATAASAGSAAPSSAYPAWQPDAAPATPNTAGDASLGSQADDIDVVEGSPAEIRLAQYQDTGPGGAAGAGDQAAPSGQPRIRFRGLSAGGPIDPRLAEMQLRLSQIVVQPPASWKLAGLREEAAALLAQEPSPQVREQLRDMLDRIATFETVAARYRGGGGTSPAAPTVAGQPSAAAVTPVAPGTSAEAMTGQSGEVLARVRSDLGVDHSITPTPGGPAPAGAQTAATTPATEALYDAVGTLKPVVSRRNQAPRYALVDDHGDVVTFVTASADLNLQPYVGKRIGVRGSRGFMPEYRRAHVTASRVTPLEEKLVR